MPARPTGRLSAPADREHLAALRTLRAAGLNPTVLAITGNPSGCVYCHAPDHLAGECPEQPGEQSSLFA